MTRSPMRLILLVALIAAAVAAPFLFDPRGYAIRILCLALLFGAMAQSWNIVAGLANQVSLGHAAFFGIGAYTSTLLLIHFGISPWLGMIAGALLGAIAALLISLPTMRLRGHYFALATLAFGEVMRVIANSWGSLTGGPVGLSVPFAPPSLAMLQFKETRPYYWLMLAALVVVTLIFVAIRRSRLGYRLRAIKENADAAEAIGVDTTRTKIIAAVISGMLTACLGTLYAQFQFFFDPDTVFGVASISVRMAMIAIVGGVGTAAGPILGAFFVIPLEEFANQIFSAQAAGLSQLVFGVLLILVILVEPRGFMAIGPRLKRLIGKGGQS
ncbi:branched-chain amino acid ABC transporter permease [Bradyrhizobium sp. U87765 SZCCT0131]|uniref:branched-chain amino acid ABC transporter permease n=1 Tax=unclassified Bradyrhizobium TaxID=2631580 RepID=UPI001BABCD6C|nr:MULTISPECIES: branched-chain amino acid ABC transporter permease [unclassified Bradyrhizobium]MBR1220391.1 branched-chain amino acid ABC transporter permease [Bradyrhizobium sp. U87765 SZCCT0131]MBR1263154.1 branched-chain amino acid ABC transporter permease [Bradyrhizobium sp. U87765 SZCCT0134]MBR1306963.1 branched-chain amino acid ABC transporter permease [Bradyrhizobium sp. U87765 SZCCT0110]MBR1323462.1 branched-chain amino acid ABC transporter permease [Bradyrhizobium sp. U87765 SZCCT010